MLNNFLYACMNKYIAVTFITVWQILRKLLYIKDWMHQNMNDLNENSWLAMD